MADEAERRWQGVEALILSPIGGAVLGALYWIVVPKYEVVAGPFTRQCAHVLGNTYCDGYSMSVIGGLLAFLVALALRALRS